MDGWMRGREGKRGREEERKRGRGEERKRGREEERGFVCQTLVTARRGFIPMFARRDDAHMQVPDCEALLQPKQGRNLLTGTDRSIFGWLTLNNCSITSYQTLIQG